MGLLEEYQHLTALLKKKEQEEQRLLGTRESCRKRLQEEHGCSSPEQARKRVAKRKREMEQYQEEKRAREKAFQKEFGDKLEGLTDDD